MTLEKLLSYLLASLISSSSPSSVIEDDAFLGPIPPAVPVSEARRGGAGMGGPGRGRRCSSGSLQVGGKEELVALERSVWRGQDSRPLEWGWGSCSAV